MCGINGKILFHDAPPLQEPEIRAMNDRIKHRGPDDEGIYINPSGQVGLGFRRLAIIDLTPTGHQPMSNEDGTVWIVFNGEIYNFQELRPELERKGHTFRSRTDTEVIIHLWEEEGEACVQKLRGMFAFAIWDQKKEILFLARDRAGKKPLKYYHDDKGLIFSSELKSFFTDPRVPRKVDKIAIDDFLTYQYPPFPATGFEDIHKLPPAHYLICEKGRIRIEKYWDVDFSKKLDLSESEWINRIQTTLAESTKIRMISDVPLGAFLSGGIDSSAVVAMMSRYSSQPVKTFSIGFKERAYDETSYARQIANLFHTDHTEFTVEPDAAEVLPHLVYLYEEPFADSSALPTYYVSKLSRQFVTVALNGDGGDEAFGGYPWYTLHRLASVYHRLLPRWIRRPLAQPLSRLARKVPHLLMQQISAALAASDQDLAKQYITFWSYFYPFHKDRLYSDAFRSHLQNHRSEEWAEHIYRACASKHPIDGALYTDIHSFLAGALLPKVDIAAMGVSLEGRSPFLDHHMMELAAQIPASLKVRGIDTKKAILKKALDGILPSEILYRKKQGFRIPLEHWFKKDLRTMAADILLSQRAIDRGYFKKESVVKILTDHAQTPIGHGRRIWALLWLELWHRTYIDPATPKEIDS